MHSDTMQVNPTLGRTLKGEYRIDSELGSGAMGVVFRGTQIALSKPVAIKMLRADGFVSKEARERFRREAHTVSMLNHPSIAQVLDFGITEEDGAPFLVMEFVDGKDLAAVIEEEGPMPPARALQIMRQLAAALEEAHRHGVVHRDIKPQNLKLSRYTPAGQIYLKVLDFGIAKQASAEGRLTATGAVLGTPVYMAPEQAGLAGGIDGRADLYAAGIVFYEMLTGTVPFDGQTLTGVLMSHLTQAPPPLPKGVPEPVRQIVERLLKKQPAERFPDAGALDRALQAAEAACRDVPALPSGSVQSRQPAPLSTSGWRAAVKLTAGALVVAAVTMYAVLTLMPLLRQGHGGLQAAGGPDLAVRQVAAPDLGGAPGPKRPDLGGSPGANGGQDPRPGVPDSGGHERSPGERRSAEAPMVAETPEVKHRFDLVMQYYEEGRFQEGVEMAQSVAGAKRMARGLELIYAGRCAQGDLGAKAWLEQMTPGQQSKARRLCQQYRPKASQD